MTLSIFPKRKRPFLLKWQLIGCSSSVVPWFQYPWYFALGVWNDFFLSKSDSVLGIAVRQWLRKHLSLKCYTCYPRSIMIEKIGFPRVWSCIPSERGSPRGGHGTDMMPMEPCDQTTSLWERGVWWAICGTFSPSNFESSMMDTMSSCSGRMSKLMERRIHQMGGPLGSTILSTSSDSEPPLSSGSQAQCGF